MTSPNSSKLSYVFNLKKHDNELDFLDLDLSSDSNLYVDPMLLYRSPIQEFNEAHTLIVEFFKRAIDYVKAGKHYKAELMCHFPDAENLLGIAETKSGHGPRLKLGNKIYEELVNNKEILENGLIFLNEFQLLIEGISYDLVSDAAVQISKQVFINFTQKQCEIHGIEMKPVTIDHCFRWEDDEWDSVSKVYLPVNPLMNNAPFLFTPYTVVRRYPEADYWEFYEEIYRYVLLAREKGTLWSGVGKEPKISFKEIKEKYRVDKAQIVNYVKQYPEQKAKFFQRIRPIEETAWLEGLSLQWRVNINSIIVPEMVETLNEHFSKAGKSPVQGNIVKAINHQAKLKKHRKKLTNEVVSLTKRCKKEDRLVLLLGNYKNPNGYKRLQEIRKILGKKYQVILLNMIKDPEFESLEQTVARWSTLARFVIVEDSYPGGQLVEIGIIKNIGVVGAILRKRGEKSTYMTVGISQTHSNFKEIEYDLIPGNGINERFVDDATSWVEERLGQNNDYWKKYYPWLS